MKGTYTHNAIDVLSRLKSASKVNTDSELCRLMNIPTNTFSNWKKRGQFNEKPIIAFCVQNRIDLTWVFTGVSLTSSVISEPMETYSKKDVAEESVLVKSLLKNIELLEYRIKQTEILVEDLAIKLEEVEFQLTSMKNTKQAG